MLQGLSQRFKLDGLVRNSKNAVFCHSRGGGNPVFKRVSGLPPEFILSEVEEQE